MTVPPPQQYAEYPRERVEPGSADRLESLAAGYFGLNWVFVANIGLAVLAQVLLGIAAAADDVGLAILFALLLVVGIPVAIGFLTYPKAKQMVYGAGWTTSPILIAVLMAINSVTCGIVGYIVLQSMAAGEIKKKFGLKSGFFGYKKKDIAARVADLRAQEAPSR